MLAQNGIAIEHIVDDCEGEQGGSETIPTSDSGTIPTKPPSNCENLFLPAVLSEEINTQTPESTPTVQLEATPTLITPVVTPTPSATPEPTAIPIPLIPFYGMQFVPKDDLSIVKELGVEVVLQDFSRNDSAEEWLSYLDAAEAVDIKIVAWFWSPGWTYDRENATWIIDDEAKTFINTIKDHPALFAIYSIHEPYWNDCFGCGYTTSELQQLYSAIKAIADVPIFADMDELVFWDDHSEETIFADGICDYCGLWYYPAKSDGSFDREKFIERIEGDIALMKEKAPNSEFVWAMQGFATGEPFNLRVPTSEEMKEIATITYSYKELFGAWWYPWVFDTEEYQDFLSLRPDLHPTLKTVYEDIVLPSKLD